MAEAEYEWDGVTRGGVTYSDTRDGLGDYRIPKPLLTNMDGSRIPVEQIVSDYGIVRNSDCEYRADMPGWFCPSNNGYHYYDMIYEMLDEDKDRRRLTPLAIVGNGYIDITNGPCDHSCCIGYACMIRLMTLHTTMACGVEYDYYFSSTTPLKAKFHFPDAPADCLVKIKFYSKRPNRIDLSKDGVPVLANNAAQTANGIEWSKPDASFIPTLAGQTYNFAGSNYHERNNQLFHFIVGGGSTYELQVVSTLVLELGVMTELTEDEFYDNGNLAANIAALLGIDPDKIRVMNVISEDTAARRKRRSLAGMEIIDVGPRRFRRNGDTTTALQFEIDPSSNSVNGANANNDLGKTIANSGSAIVNATLDTIVNEMGDESATAEEELAIAAAPVPPPTPEEPVTLAEQLGIEDIQMGEDLDEFLEKIQSELDVPLEELETADERMAEEQAEADAALEPIVYTTPAQIEMTMQPSAPMILDVKFYQDFTIIMRDSNGNIMSNVGFVTEPWQMKVSMLNVVESGPNQGKIDGKTVVEFKPGDGRAIFDDITVKGDVTSAQFEFVVFNPADGTNGGVASLMSNVIEFLPPAKEEACNSPIEGTPFDKKQSWQPDCSYVCMQSCVDLGDLAKPPVCEVVTSCDADNFGSCTANGCECDTSGLPAIETDLDPTTFLTANCNGNSLELRVNKCVMNHYGFMLKDTYTTSPVKGSFADLVAAAEPNCRGRLGFGDGAQYVFTIDRSKNDCGTDVANDGSKVTYSSAVHAYVPEYTLQVTNAVILISNYFDFYRYRYINYIKLMNFSVIFS